MHRIILYVLGLLCLFLTDVYSQETESFENKTKSISENIERIVSLEKERLKTATDSINILVQNNFLSEKEADEINFDLAQKSSDKINMLVSEEEEKLVELVQKTVDEQIENPTEDDSDYLQKRTKLNTVWMFGWRGVYDSNGIDSDVNGSYFSIGLNFKTRLFENRSTYYLKYGLSINSQYENLQKSQKHYVVDGDQTHRVNFTESLRKNSVFTNTFVRIPLGLEFDFSKKATIQGKDVYRVNRGMKFSVGGYLGYNVESNQTLRYRGSEGKTTLSRKADWNVNDWEYGLTASVSYKTIGFYVDYGLNPVFRNNPTDKRIISFGIIFE